MTVPCYSVTAIVLHSSRTRRKIVSCITAVASSPRLQWVLLILCLWRKVIYCTHTAGRIRQTQKQATASATAKQATECTPGFFIISQVLKVRLFLIDVFPRSKGATNFLVFGELISLFFQRNR